MKILKHILVVIALLATLLPCSHAFTHHEHDHGSAAEICAVSTTPCECHSCDSEPCSDTGEIQFDTFPGTLIVDTPSNPAVLFIFSEPRFDKRTALLPDRAILAVLETIQLLI
jgi:hypothetical protein